MHKEQPRRFDEHVAVHSSYLDAIVAQRANHRVDLAGDQNKVSGDGGFASACRLKIDGMGYAHRRRHFHVVVHDLFSTRNAELIDAAVYFSTLSHDLVELLRIDSQILSLIASSGRGERSLAERERIMNSLGDLHAVAH